jgi:hypothetical protein
MAQNPKPTRRERKRNSHQTRIAKRLIREVVNEDWEYRSDRTKRKRREWRKNANRRLAEMRVMRATKMKAR